MSPEARRRLLHDTGIAGLLVAAMIVEALVTSDDRARLDAAAIGLMVLTVLPTYARHRHPGWALAVAVVLIYPLLLEIDVHNTAPFSSMLCGYALALVVDRRRTGLAALAVVPAVVFLVVRFDHSSSVVWTELPKNLLYVAGPLLVGVAVRNRRAYLAALVDRAETAERTREEEAARRVFEERLRIAQDLHDVVAHAMVAINVQAGVGLHLLDRDPWRARRTLEDIRQASGEALGDLRATLGVLRAGTPADAPVAPAPGLGDLPALVAGLRSAGVEVRLDLDPAAVDVPTGVGGAAYRIVQEALTNVVRHAASPVARVHVRRGEGDRGDVLSVVVDDDGAPPGASGRRDDPGPSAPAGSGNGVRGMAERATALGGTLAAGPRADGPGWRVRAELPVPS